MRRISNLKNQKGFSLIETSIGLAIFGLVGTIILIGLGVVSKSNLANVNLTEAESLARAQIEYIQSQPYHAANNGTIHPAAYSTINVPTGYSFPTPVANMATRIDSNGNSVTTDAGLQKISVSVQYNNNTLFTITGYKVNK